MSLEVLQGVLTRFFRSIDNTASLSSAQFVASLKVLCGMTGIANGRAVMLLMRNACSECEPQLRALMRHCLAKSPAFLLEVVTQLTRDKTLTTEKQKRIHGALTDAVTDAQMELSVAGGGTLMARFYAIRCLHYAEVGDAEAAQTAIVDFMSSHHRRPAVAHSADRREGTVEKRSYWHAVNELLMHSAKTTETWKTFLREKVLPIAALSDGDLGEMALSISRQCTSLHVAFMALLFGAMRDAAPKFCVLRHRFDLFVDEARIDAFLRTSHVNLRGVGAFVALRLPLHRFRALWHFLARRHAFEEREWALLLLAASQQADVETVDCILQAARPTPSNYRMLLNAAMHAYAANHRVFSRLQTHIPPRFLAASGLLFHTAHSASDAFGVVGFQLLRRAYVDGSDDSDESFEEGRSRKNDLSGTLPDAEVLHFCVNVYEALAASGTWRAVAEVRAKMLQQFEAAFLALIRPHLSAVVSAVLDDLVATLRDV